MGCCSSNLSTGLLGVILPSFVNCGVSKFPYLYDLTHSVRFVSLTQSTMYCMSQVYRAAFEGRAYRGGTSGTEAFG